MKKLWIVNHYAGTPRRGMVFRSYYLAKSLEEYGVDTTIFSSSFTHVLHSPPDVCEGFTETDEEGVKFIWVKNLKYGSSASLGRLLNMIFFSVKLLFHSVENKNRPDAIIVSSPSPFPVINGYLWSKKFKCKLVFEVRDIWPLTLKELSGIGSFNPVYILMRIIEKFAYRVSDEVVSVLPCAASHMTASGLKREKFNYIPNGVLTHKASFEEEYNLNLPQDYFIVGYTGTIGVANNISLLVKTAEILKDAKIKFVIVGEGGSKASLIRTCKERQLENVLFLPAVEKKYIPNILSQFDLCFISLKPKKIFKLGVSPNKLFDYFLAGKPIVYCIDSGNNPVSEAGVGIEVKSNRPDEVARAILELKSKTSKERRKMGEAGIEYVKEKHSYLEISRNYFDILF